MACCNHLQHGEIDEYLKYPRDLTLLLDILVIPVPKIFCCLYRCQKLHGLDRVLFKFHIIFSLSCTSCENQLALVKLSCCMFSIMKNTNCVLVIFAVCKKEGASEFFSYFSCMELPLYFW